MTPMALPPQAVVPPMPDGPAMGMGRESGSPIKSNGIVVVMRVPASAENIAPTRKLRYDIYVSDTYYWGDS